VTPAGADLLLDPRPLDDLALARAPAAKPMPAPEPAPESPIHRTGFPWLAWALIAGNVVTFFAGMLYAESLGVAPIDYLQGNDAANVSRALYQLGSLYGPAVLEGHEWKRVPFHLFLHFGLFHLICNMMFLVLLGQALEAMWGPGKL